MYTVANTLSLNPSFMVLFEKTKQPYITEEGECVIYLRKEDAGNFLNEHPGAVLDESKFYKAEELCSMCYGAGAVKIKVIMPGCEKERYEDLTRMPIKKYYNHSLNKNINLLHETKRKEYLYALKKENYIVPVKITNKPEMKIEYSIAKANDRKLFVAFTCLEEFDLWNKNIGGYEALEITYSELIELSGNDDIVLNISGARYILSQEKIKKMGKPTTDMVQ